MWLLNNKKTFIFHNKNMESAKSRCQVRCLVRAHLLVHRCQLFWLCPDMAGGAKELLWGLFYKGIHPIHVGSSLMSSSLLKAPTS